MRRNLLRHAEGHRRDEPLEVRIASKAARIDAPQRGKKTQIEETLLFGRTEEEVAARELQNGGGVVVAVLVETERLGVVQVLDHERIVQIDRHRQRGPLLHEIVGEISLRDRRRAIRQQLA